MPSSGASAHHIGRQCLGVVTQMDERSPDAADAPDPDASDNGRAAQIAGKEAPMLKTLSAFSTFAVPDIDAAERFYGDTLGLEVRREPEMGMLEIKVGGGPPITIYPKPDHEPANFTVFNVLVEDIDAAVDELNRSGVQMKRYELDMPVQPDDRNIYRGMGPAIAWFTDPAGNILSVMEQPRN